MVHVFLIKKGWSVSSVAWGVCASICTLPHNEHAVGKLSR
jgi:hypothetical protein